MVPGTYHGTNGTRVPVSIDTKWYGIVVFETWYTYTGMCALFQSEICTIVDEIHAPAMEAVATTGSASLLPSLEMSAHVYVRT
jgi:hypothetical protein